MDLLSLFRSSPEKQIQKLRKKVKEPHGDASVRQGAAERLAQMDDPKAIRALLDRFLINVTPSVEDEAEKEMVFHWLVEKGEEAVPPLTSFLKTERTVYWPARSLRAILDGDRLADEFCGILQYHWENPPADAYPTANLIRTLEGIVSQDLDRTVAHFLEHEDDDVRLAAVEYFLSRPEEVGREKVLQCFVDSEERPRIRNQILDHLVEMDWSVRGYRPAFEEALREGFSLTRDGKVQKFGS